MAKRHGRPSSQYRYEHYDPWGPGSAWQHAERPMIPRWGLIAVEQLLVLPGDWPGSTSPHGHELPHGTNTESAPVRAACPGRPSSTDMLQEFNYTSFDAASRLPEAWQDQVLAATADAEFRNFPRTPVLTREAAQVAYIKRGRVHADQVRSHLPWLYELYHGHFLELAASTRAESVAPARDDRYGLVLNVQHGTAMRFECHVDSNPLTGLLFCTDHPGDAGGELVFGHDPQAADVAAVERDCSAIRPRAGQLIFFDGRKHPHYARPLRSGSDRRVVAVMNFYTASCPESTRPLELNSHLYGES